MRRRIPATLLLASVTAGCTQWAVVDLSGPSLTPEDVPSDVRLLGAAGDTIVLRDAALRGDSITGFREGGAPASVALSDVQSLEGRRAGPIVMLAPALIIGFIVVPRVFSHSVREGTPGSVVTDGS
jgi:hypothetical protein